MTGAFLIMRKHAIIVAGGTGTRMGGSIRKQYLPLAGLPVLMHTLHSFYRYSEDINLVLVLPAVDMDYWQNLCTTHGFSVPHILVSGGSTRFQSVRNGLNSISFNDGLVAIHDGVRPFAGQELIAAGFEEAALVGNAIAAVPLKDSIRKLGTAGGSVSCEREYFRLVQTPQTFLLSKIRQAYEVTEQPHFTDDASVYEHGGWPVHLIAGNPANIKITTPEDMEYADFLFRKYQTTTG